MNFGEAIELVKRGKLATRKGWNGKGMFIFMRPRDFISAGVVIDQVKSLPESVKTYFIKDLAKGDEGEIVSKEVYKYLKDEVLIEFTPYLCMKAADNTIVNGWLASQTDILSEDWEEFVP